MAFLIGNNTKVVIDDDDLSAYFRQADTESSRNMGKTTTFGKTAETYVPGLVDGKLSLQGLYDATADAQLAAMLSNAGGKATSVGVEGLAAGKRVKVMSALAAMLKVSSPVGDIVAVNLELNPADSGVETAVSLKDLASEAASTNGTGQDNAASSANGGVATLHVTANTRNGTFDCKIQHSVDNSVWADLTGATFTQLAASTPGSERKEVAAGTTVNRYLRYVSTIAGATGAITHHSSFARR